ncbi:MAG: 4Fe-4S dicluster domain-containing protein [Candidatus Krumholzibacteriota bacterium]|nr:4Fe-4S dicluster domain-containing protein [Candidatus Krumholzibacteriota bacterium]
MTDIGKEKKIIDIDRRLCIVCGACSAACPNEALIIEGMNLEFIPERCRPCGQAAIVCPTGALTCPR